MTKRKTCTVTASSAADTEQLAEQIGSRLHGSELIELVSDLGGGKTTFTRGLVKGLGSQDKVASPTFTISKVYKSSRLTVHHFDFYRLADAGLAAYELNDLIDDPETVIVVEWGGVVQHVLPEDRLTITISRTGETTRELQLQYPGSLQYLVEDIC